MISSVYSDIDHLGLADVYWVDLVTGGQLDVVLTPQFDKHTKVDASADLGSETHQVFGTWSGRLLTDDGLALDLTNVQGFAEEARQRW